MSVEIWGALFCGGIGLSFLVAAGWAFLYEPQRKRPVRHDPKAPLCLVLDERRTWTCPYTLEQCRRYPGCYVAREREYRRS